ncbi:Myosin heavy chain [Fusarium acuminatum]|uniref:Myosin heavy chain n=1 Tax=Fusarium acuminatum TaxID=5515 RepID=A0ABZ2XAQ7_9HYPO
MAKATVPPEPANRDRHNKQAAVKTSSTTSSPAPPGAFAQDGNGAYPSRSRPASPASPTLSNTSTVDGEEEIESSPVLPSLQAPRLPERALQFLRTPPPEDTEFGTASWGSPYPQSDRNLRRESSGSEASDESLIHHLDIATPFLRPIPDLLRSQSDPQGSSLSAAAAVLANRARRPTRGLTEDWIRTHTTDDPNEESRHWFSDGSEGEHSSLSGSEPGWLEDGEPRTPRPAQRTINVSASRDGSRHHPRARSSIETLRPGDSLSPKTGQNSSMATSEAAPATHDAASDRSQAASTPEVPVAESPKKRIPSITKNGEPTLPSTPKKGTEKPLPKEPAPTPRLKKKVPWRGKNIMVLIPRDTERGQPGNAPMPLRQHEIQRMFSSWEELGYDISGFDLEVEGYQVEGTADSQTRDAWPDFDEVAKEREEHSFKVTLPDLNAWNNYMNELQEAKLRALGVSFGDDEHDQPSPAATDLSRQPSAQYPPLPFSPPLPTSSASSGHALPGFQPGHFARASTHSPGLSHRASPLSFSGLPGKFNSRQSVSFPANSSPFGYQQPPQGWPGVNRHDSPSIVGMMSPHSPFGPESPGINLHQRHQSLQYPMMPHQQFSYLQPARNSPRLQEVLEDEEEAPVKSPAKTPEPPQQQNTDTLQAEIDDAEYHLEEQLRNELEHEDYNPQPQNEQPASLPDPFVPAHARQASGQFPVQERFANEQSKPLVLHHPRPHSRGHSLSQGYFRDHNENSVTADESNLTKFSSLNEIPESHKPEEAYEIETNPSNLGTPAQEFDFPGFGHQKNFSTSSNPWNDATSVDSSRKMDRRSSHVSKPSLSKLNVKAPEFKFNPASSFTPGQFDFGSKSNTFQPGASTFEPTANSFEPTASAFKPSVGSFQPGASSFQPGASSFQPGAGAFRPGASSFQPTSSTFEPMAATFQPTISTFDPNNFQAASFEPAGFQPAVFQANTSFPDTNRLSSPPVKQPSFVTPARINAAAPSFSPGDSTFSFSTSGPKFNVAAPEFTPHSDSFVSPVSQGQRGSIFGSIDVSSDDMQSNKKSKAVPIVRPSSQSSAKSEEPEQQYDADGHALADENRVKRARSSAPGGDDVPLFAEQPAQDDVSAQETQQTTQDEHLPADTSMSSIVTSDQVDTKATTAAPSAAPSVTSANENNNWKPFEFESNQDIQSFNDARPFGEDDFKHGHKKSLSATAEPFQPGASSLGEATPPTEQEEESDPSPVVSPVPARPTSGLDASRFSTNQPQPRTVSKGLGASRFADPPKPVKGLAASRFAKSPTPEEKPLPAPPVEDDVVESVESDFAPELSATVTHPAGRGINEPTFEEIDAVMDQFFDDPTMGVNKSLEASQWQQNSPIRNLSTIANSSPYKLDPVSDHYARDEASLTPRDYHQLPRASVQPMPSTELEDPFIDPPEALNAADGAVDGESLPASDWEAAFTEDEHDKLENRAQFFDGRVHEVVGTLLASRLEPLEKTLFSIQQVLATRARRTPSSRRDMRSVSAELQQSDADDEDEEPIFRRSISPRRDRRLDQIRIAVMEGLQAQQRNKLEASPTPAPASSESPSAAILEALEGLKQQFSSNANRDDGLKQMIQEVVDARAHTSPKTDEAENPKLAELQQKVTDLEQRLYFEQTKVENEVSERRAAEDLAAELNRKLQTAETRIEVEIINRSVFDQRVVDLEERLRTAEEVSEEAVNARRAAEDKLTEARVHRETAAEELVRLRELVEHRDHKLRSLEQANSKTAMRIALLEAAQNNATQAQHEAIAKCKGMEVELKDVRQDNHHWRAEAERYDESSRQKGASLTRALEDNQHMHKSLTTLATQLEENERVREMWRSKFVSLQEDMGRAAREIAEDNARRIQKDQAMLARHEVLDARLQAEAKTRERLEIEMERLQSNERAGMRATNECARLEGVIGELKTENLKLEQKAMRHQREFEEARESGLSEVKRTRMALQTEIDAANNQVNYIREELEEHNSKLRAELDNVRLEVDTAKAQNEMLLEEAENSKMAEVGELTRKHQNEIEDLQTRYERRVHNAQEDAHKTEQHLLERLSLSASKTEHLQDRILHLEDKLEIAKQAAQAAAQAAKSAGAEINVPIAQPRQPPRDLEPPGRISPQALRESIMVLQEQLQAREQRIEELEQSLSKTDPDASTKITKRDDEITWLRELLAVRHENLQDIIAALQSDRFDRDAVKDAAIRLKANLQMEEQERERAMNGGSAINLPNIAQTIQNASPRVAQTIGPLAAAWGNWRKGNRSQPSLSSLSGVLSSPAPRRNATPSRSNSTSQNNPLGGLMTPPASGLRQTPPVDSKPQPTAFASTGRRFPSQSHVPGRARGASNTSHRAEQAVITPPPVESEDEPMTPPMMRTSGYDSDAQPGDFDDNDFFED